MHHSPTRFSATGLSTSAAATVARMMVAGLGAGLFALVLAGRVPEPVIVVGVIVVASLVSWSRTSLVPARVRAQHRFTVVSKLSDGFVTIDSSGVRRVSRHLISPRP